MSDLIDRQETLKHIENIRQGAQMMSDMHRAAVIMGMDLLEEAVKNQPSAQTDTTLLAQKIWTKVCLITDPEDANIQHEVIHYGDLKQVFLEVLGWEI